MIESALDLLDEKERAEMDGVSERAGSARAEMEARVGVDPIEWLQHLRRLLLAKAAPLRARRDTFDARRKSQRGLVTVRILDGYAGEGKKPPAADTVEMMASGDAGYVAFLDRAEGDFALLAVLENEIASVTEIINRDQALIRWSSSEPK